MINSFKFVTKALPYLVLCLEMTVLEVLFYKVIAYLRLPKFSICYHFLKNVVIYDGKCVVLEAAGSRSLFYFRETSGCFSKPGSASEKSTPVLGFHSFSLCTTICHRKEDCFILFLALSFMNFVFSVRILRSIFAFLSQHLNLYNLGLVMVSDG